MGRTIRTCSLALALALAAAPVAAGAATTVVTRSSPARIFVSARAAQEAGDARRAAVLYAMLAQGDPASPVLSARAIGQAIIAGDMPLALRLSRARPARDLAVDARLLLAADALKSGKGAEAIGADWPEELAFLSPFVRAWSAAERGRWKDAVALLDAVPSDRSLAQFVPEHKALILLGAGRSAEARPLIESALAAAGGRANRLRIAFAAGLLRDGDRAGAQALLQGRDITLVRASQALARSGKPRLPIATAAEGFAELLAGLAVSLGDNDRRSLPIAISRIAQYADPANDEVRVLLGLLLEQSGRSDDAIATLRAMPEGSPFLSQARDAEVRSLLRAGRKDEALARASAFVASGEASAEDWSRLGDVNDEMKRHAAAAEAYGRALALVEAGGPGPEAWSLNLLRGASLEQAGSWPEARKSLEAARALAPDNATVLNYVGYARLTRGEGVEEAERLIAEASRRDPDNAAITDSLGWAQYKRGRIDEAIVTLQRAAAAEPADPEINEHLGDALYAAGRRFEARFAWNAALVTAEDEAKTRIEAKLAAGLTPAVAAP